MAMKSISTVLIFMVLSVTNCHGRNELNLSGVTHIGFWDLKVSDLNQVEKRIKSPYSVEKIVNIFMGVKLKWKTVVATSPAGDIRLIFYFHNDMIEAVGVGDGFMVRGTAGNSRIAEIDEQLEIKIREAVQSALEVMSNQKLDRGVKTPGESDNVQGAARQL